MTRHDQALIFQNAAKLKKKKKKFTFYNGKNGESVINP